jgi:hypothetical protein
MTSQWKVVQEMEVRRGKWGKIECLLVVVLLGRWELAVRREKGSKGAAEIWSK